VCADLRRPITPRGTAFRTSWDESRNPAICRGLYTSVLRGGPGVSSWHSTKDFRVSEKLGVAWSPDDKDAALLPRRINGSWALILRPMTPASGAHIWIFLLSRFAALGLITAHAGGPPGGLGGKCQQNWNVNPPPIETSARLVG